MRTTIESDSYIPVGGRTPVLLVSLLAGSLVLVALVAFAGGSDAFARPQSPQQTTTRPDLNHTGRVSILDPIPQEVYYFVNTQAQAEKAAYMEDDASRERASINVPEPSRRVHVLMMATEAQEVEAENLVSDASQDALGVQFAFVDLRQP